MSQRDQHHSMVISSLHLQLQSLNTLSLCLSIPQFDVLLRAINHWCQLHQWKQLFRIGKGQGNVAKKLKTAFFVCSWWLRCMMKLFECKVLHYSCRVKANFPAHRGRTISSLQPRSNKQTACLQFQWCHVPSPVTLTLTTQTRGGPELIKS